MCSADVFAHRLPSLVPFFISQQMHIGSSSSRTLTLISPSKASLLKILLSFAPGPLMTCSRSQPLGPGSRCASFASFLFLIWFYPHAPSQLFNPNGTITINTGPSGLQRLDKILASAKANGLMVQLSLTNNWNPLRPLLSPNTTLAKRAGTNTTTNVTHPPGFLSNDYGGMDAYVRAHNLTEHDQFFTNQTLINAFQNYLNVLVPRYANNTELLSWEVANDARCNSTLPNSPTCVSQVR